ncbi:MAG TPA: ribose 5-phosphate isomerase B [Anaerolineae bacterium]|nr:ribose 5-phosphate isomerase B [Anaerolineae bacterium]HOQ98761.1 ribose 5-phosphate isomerase B [Anaerolineae bacterium]HPL29001.1 ribose 5-phosphate isomerase B [Anaerolineae bacterium]
MRIAIASDHAAVALKSKIVAWLQARGHEAVDLGPTSPESVDYPDYAERVTAEITAGRAASGILICGTGIGMSLAANKVPGIRAAVANDPFMARLARAHNDANILCLGARVIGDGLAEAILEAWLGASFEGGRHARRVDKISAIERRWSGPEADA